MRATLTKGVLLKKKQTSVNQEALEACLFSSIEDADARRVQHLAYSGIRQSVFFSVYPFVFGRFCMHLIIRILRDIYS